MHRISFSFFKESFFLFFYFLKKHKCTLHHHSILGGKQASSCRLGRQRDPCNVGQPRRGSSCSCGRNVGWSRTWHPSGRQKKILIRNKLQQQHKFNTYTQSGFMAFTHWALDAITMGFSVLVVVGVILWLGHCTLRTAGGRQKNNVP